MPSIVGCTASISIVSKSPLIFVYIQRYSWLLILIRIRVSNLALFCMTPFLSHILVFVLVDNPSHHPLDWYTYHRFRSVSDLFQSYWPKYIFQSRSSPCLLYVNFRTDKGNSHTQDKLKEMHIFSGNFARIFIGKEADPAMPLLRSRLL